jgi:hypothetical protein
MPKKLILVATAAFLLGLVACDESGGDVTLPSPIPTESVSRAVCDARGRVFDLVGQVQTGAVESKADVATRLRDLAEQLDSEAGSLRSQGLGSAANSVSALSTATSQLADAVEGADTAAIVSAAAKAATAIQEVPGCPPSSPTPSPSPSPTPSASPST